MKWICTWGFLFTSLALHAQNKKAEQLFSQGEEAFQEGRFEEAKSYLTRCIQEDPDYTEAYYYRAKARESLKDNAGALTDLNSCLELAPNQPEVLFSRGQVQYETGRYENAKEDFLNVLALSAGETNTVFYNRSASAAGTHQILTLQGSVKPLLYNYIGLAETKLGHYDEAVLWLDSAIKLERKSADYYVNRGIAFEGLKKDSAATADYQKALVIQPDHPVAMNNLAVLKRKLGTGGLEDMDHVIDSDSSMLNPYLERAQMRFDGGFYKGALEDYNSAIRINDRNPEIWLNRGLTKEKLNDLKGAYSDYTQAIELDEDFVKAWTNRGNVLSKQGRMNEAVEDYSAAITFVPDHAVAYYNRAIAYHKLKQSQKACDDLKKAEELGHKVEEKVKKGICVP